MLRRVGGYVLVVFGVLLIVVGIGISLIAARPDIVINENAPLPNTTYPYALPYGIPTSSIGIVLVIAGVFLLKYRKKEITS